MTNVNIYGKILSSADRKVSIKEYFISSLFFGHTNIDEVNMEDAIEKSYDHAIKKFGKDGYATKKFYVEDNRYQKFLNDLQELIENKALGALLTGSGSCVFGIFKNKAVKNIYI